MKSINKGLRRVGIVGLSTVVAASMMTGLAATASATAGDYAALTTPNVAQGAAAAPAGSVALSFANNFVATNTQTFQIKPGGAANVCTTVSGLAASIGFAANPTVAVTGPFNAAGTAPGTAAPAPAFAATAVPSKSNAACTKNDIVTITTTSTSVAPLTDTWKVTLSGITYDVGGSAAVGSVALVTAGLLVTGPATVNNATVVAASHTSIPVITAQIGSHSQTLGAFSFVESTTGAYFAADNQLVTLKLKAGSTFTTGVTPTITATAGYTVTTATVPATDGTATYTFHMDVPATLTAATVTISGLKLEAPAGADAVTITGDTDFASAPAPVAINAARVLDFAARTGGSDRFATAAALFSAQFGATGSKAANVVLSSGSDFPDALSANYLAKQLATGTLLTRPTIFSTAARAQILNGFVTTVYITGKTGAVSQGVQDQIEALHVGNDAAKPFITVHRLGGAGRYETNKIINENTFVPSGTVLLASGQDFPDALALGAVAYKNTLPLILTKGVTLGASETSQLTDFGATNVIIAGGAGVVSKAIADSLTARGITVTRLWGTDRTLTAQAVATWATSATATPAHALFVSQEAYIARGDDFADALAAGPVAGFHSNVIVLTKNLTTLGVGIPAYLGSKVVGPAATQVGILHALGQTGAVPVSVMKDAAATVGMP